MRSFQLFIFGIVFSVTVIAQNTAPDNEIIEKGIAGFDTNAYHPLYIQSQDGKFKLNLGFYTQIRYNMNWRHEVPDTVQHFTRGYNMARSRIFFEGDMTEHFYYHFRVNVNPAGEWELFVAYLQWNIHKKWNLRMGKQFMALGREDWIYPQDLATMEFSAHNFTYAIWTSFGLQLRHVPAPFFRYWLGVGNGAYGSRQKFPQPSSSDLGLTSRFEWNVLSSPWINWDDLTGRPGQEFGILVGIGLGYQKRYDEEVIETEAADARQYNADFSISGNRFHFFSHASITWQYFKEQPNLNRDDTEQSGFYSTLGYWPHKKVFVYGRYDAVIPDGKSGLLDYQSPGIGVSFYPFEWTRRTRITLEYNRLKPILNRTMVEPDGQLGLVETDFGPQEHLRIQLQFGF